MTEYWSWILTIVGVTGFILAGKKVWWCWYINIACQALWMTYAIVTEQWGFIIAALIYTVVFTKNAIAWTKEHRYGPEIDFNEYKYSMPSVVWEQLEAPADRLPGDIWVNPDTGVAKAWSDEANDWIKIEKE